MFRFGIDLAEDDVSVSRGSLFEDRCEGTAWTAPSDPKVQQHDVVVVDGLLKVVQRDLYGAHEK